MTNLTLVRELHVFIPVKILWEGRWGVFIRLLCICLSLSSSAGADPRRYEGKRVVAIRFEPESQAVEASELAAILPLKVNSPLRLAEVRAAIKRLHATGRFQDIEVRAEPAAPASDGVIVTLATTNRNFIGRVELEGKVKEPPNRSQLVNSTRLELGQPFARQKLEQATEGIEQLLRSNGFYEATIEPHLDEEPATQQVHFRFVVRPGNRARLDTPRITGDLKLPESNLASATKWKGWFGPKHATQQRVDRGLDHIRNKYRGEDRLMARVSLESMDYDSRTRLVKPTLRVDAGPKADIHVSGAKISGKRLHRYVPVFQERTVDRDLLVEGARNLRDHFQIQGYFDVQVDFEENTISEDAREIVYRVDLGRRQKLHHIEVLGHKFFDTETIRERMFLQPSSLLRFRRGRFSEGFLRADRNAIADLYRSNGFRDVAVNARIVNDQHGPGSIAVIIEVEEGPQWFVSGLQVDGVERADRDVVLSRLSSIEGQPFSELNVSRDRDEINAYYQANGFPDASFEWDMKQKPETHQVDLRFVVTEGQPRYVRDVLTGGLATTKPGLVQRNMQIARGDPLSWSGMTSTQRTLYDLGVFAKVDMAIQNPDGETQRKYVLYQVEEGQRYSVAGGIGAEIGRIGGGREELDPTGGTGLSPRVSLDASRLNFLGLGHSIHWRSRVSTLQRRGMVTYMAPRFRNIEGRDLSFTSLYDNSRDVRTFSAKRLEGSAQLSQRLSKASTALYRFSYRNVSVDRNTLKIEPLLVPLLAQPARIGMLGGNLIQDRRDDPADTYSGIYNTLDLGFASRIFGSTKSFSRFLVRNATYHRVKKNTVLARTLSLGWLQAFQRAASPTDPSIPLPERFFGGGGTSHRGFPDNQAGPRDLTTGFPLGGRALLFHSTELRFPLLGDNIRGVLFHDAGNVYSSIRNFSFRATQRDLADFDYMVHGVGVGLRYRTPIGPIRADAAYSINPPRYFGFRGTRQELLFGGGTRGEQRVSHFQFFISIGQTF